MTGDAGRNGEADPGRTGSGESDRNAEPSDEPTPSAAETVGVDGDGASGRERVGSRRPESVLGLPRFRRDPLLLVPFLLAGIGLQAADRLRESDPLPATSALEPATVNVSYAIYPTGTPATSRSIGALVDLHLPALGYALGLEALAVLVVAAAGWITIARAAGERPRLGRFGAYLGLVVAFDLAYRSLDAAGAGYDGGSLLLALGSLAVIAYGFVRLFLLPTTVLLEGGFARSIGASWRRSRGVGGTILALVLLFGIGSWLLARVPSVGTALSAAVVGSVHAVSLAVLYERTDETGQR